MPLSSLVRLQDDLRAAGARWNAGATAVWRMHSIARRGLLDPFSADEQGLDLRAERARRVRAVATRGTASHERRAWLPATSRRRAVWAVAEAMLGLTQGVRPEAVVVERGWPTFEVGGRRVWVESLHELESTAAMKQWLVEHGPLLAVVAVHEDFYAYVNGVYHHVAGALEGGHCVAVVGFDDAGEYWTAQNCWGVEWGEQGFFRIAFGERGIDASMWGIELGVEERG